MNNSIDLLKLLKYSKNNIEFYKEKIPTEIDRISNNKDIGIIFRSLPIVDKQIIKANYLDFLDAELTKYDLSDIFDTNKNFRKEYAFEFPDYKIIAEYTSGTTGSPFIALKTPKERLILGRNLWELRRNFHSLNSREFFMLIHTNGEYPFPFSEEEIDSDKLTRELKFLSTSSYTWWHLYPKLLQTYADYSTRLGIEFNNLKVIETNGSYISDQEKKNYEEIFGCRIANNYGCREIWAIAYDCPHGYLHINDKAILFELVDEHGREITNPNEVGYVVLTSLKLRSMPFIRYKIGDLAYYLSGECSCGNKSRRICVTPGRHLIAGTQMYGNQYFRSVVVNLIQYYGITKFNSISVMQTDYRVFMVNIKGNKEDRTLIEKYFIESANDVLGIPNCSYIFTYDENLESKSIFTLKIQKNTN
ncbi:hypothetical protein [Paenibacillus lautus]|uniref:hypothetical protein n=1 Tax=Paenibacillus lautus TaxID=1401 RepID=UPI003D2C3608